MRVSLVLACGLIACGAARGAEPPGTDSSGVTVNLKALTIPTPRAKPSPEEMRPSAQVRPRFKPEPGAFAVIAPRWKPVPDTEVAAVEAPPVAPAQPAAVPAPASATPKVEAPAPPPAAPVTIVSTSAPLPYKFPVEISGVAQDSNGNTKPINPLEGFAVLSRVHFSIGKTDIASQEQRTLDEVVQRLLASHERVRLAAFSGKLGDASSEARRLSLARALAIRSYLVAKGISVDRVDVLAYGGAKENITDRVHVLVRGT